MPCTRSTRITQYDTHETSILNDTNCNYPKKKRKKNYRLANHHRFFLESENGLTIFTKQVNAVMFNHYSHLGIVHIILSEVSQQPQTKKLVQWLVTQFSKKNI